MDVFHSRAPGLRPGPDDHELTAARDDPGPSRREQRRHRHQSLSREQLLDAAEEIFGRKGYHETTLKEVAELAEFSVGLRVLVLREQGRPVPPDLRAAGRASSCRCCGRCSATERRRARAAPPARRLRDRVVPRPTATSAGSTCATPAPPALLRPGGQDAVIARQLRGVDGPAGRRCSAGARRPGVLASGDPEVLARLFSGIISAFQALDPAVVSDDPGAGRALPAAELHDLVEAAFVGRSRTVDDQRPAPARGRLARHAVPALRAPRRAGPLRRRPARGPQRAHPGHVLRHPLRRRPRQPRPRPGRPADHRHRRRVHARWRAGRAATTTAGPTCPGSWPWTTRPFDAVRRSRQAGRVRRSTASARAAG